MAKASPTQAWLWHRRLSHLNFDYINLLSKKDVVIGLPKLKYVKDQLCSSCEVSKEKRSTFKIKIVPSSKGRLNLHHMDLYGPMLVASINGKKYILEEVYVARPDGFLDPDHSEKVYRLRKALYGLKQAPRAWYDEILNFLISKGFTKGLQLYQSLRGIFINQAKYALKILKKHGMEKGQSIGTPMATRAKLNAGLSGKLIDQTNYLSKIRPLMYLTSSRLDIVQSVCYYARYQARSTEKHLKEVKRIFRYLRGTIDIGLWYLNDSSFELTAFSDVDHAGYIDTHKSTSRGI
nr:hypothetical protein [Tanacetum cinerariifolium]